MKEPDQYDVGLATAVSIILFCVFSFLTLVILSSSETASFLVRIGLVTITCFYGWLWFFASPAMRMTVMKWLPIFPW